MLLDEFSAEIAAPRAALLSNGVVLVSLPDGADDAAMRGQAMLSPPYGTVDVRGAAGSHRIAAMRVPEAGGDVSLQALIEGRAADPAELAEALDAESCRRLLGFLLGFCRSAFRLAGDPGFVRTCVRLARLCAEDAGDAMPVAVAGAEWMVLAGVRAPKDATVYVLGDRVRHGAAATGDDGGLQLVPPVRAGELVLALCERPLIWTVRNGAGALPDVLQRAGRGAASGALRAACLRALAPAGGPVAAMLREMQVMSPAAPRKHDDVAAPVGAALEVALPDGAGGLFLRGWLRDPLQLIAGAELRTPIASKAVDLRRLFRVRRADVAGRFEAAAFRDGEARAGFVAHVPDPSKGLCAQPGLVLRLHSGTVIELTAPLRHMPAAAGRDAVLSCVPPGEVTPAMLDECLAPAACALHRQALAESRVAEVVQIGTPARTPGVSIIVPLYRNLDFIRFQAAAFAADAECRRAEIIFVLDSPEQRVEVEHLLRGLSGLHRLSFGLVVMGCNAGYAAANNAAAGVARGAALLLLNSDVAPSQPGWLAAMRAGLAAPGVGAVGPKLLFDDGSIQHAGLMFARDGEGTWFNAHYYKGMPGAWPAAQKRRRVPGVTGAALLVRRALFEAVGGICQDYIIGDYEDSDFCLRVRAGGAAIAYVPEAELYHFERRSIRLHAGYTRTLASLYNRRLHHRRWDAEMTALMGQKAYRVAA